MDRRGILSGVPALTWIGEAAAASDRSSNRVNPAANPRPADQRLQVGGPAGAVADGASHPLSSRFPSMAAAKAVYPHASALTDEIDWCVLQGAINATAARGGGAVQVPNTGRPYVLNKDLVINPNLVTMRGEGSVLHFGKLKGPQRAIWFKADGAPNYGHEKHVFEGFELIGPGADADGVVGLFFQTDTPALSSRALVRDCAVHDFHVGAQFGNRAYLIGFAHCSFYRCRICVDCPYGLEDAGENISFSQCALFNSYCCVTNGGGFGLRFLACSFDYARRIVWDNNGLIDFVGCHIETAPPTEPLFHTGHGRTNFFGGFFLVNDAKNVGTPAPELFAFNIPSGSVHMFSLHGWNWRTSSGKLTKGPGRIYRYSGDEISDVPADIGHP